MSIARRHSSRYVFLAAILAAFPTISTAADQIIDFDRQVDFSTVRTFTLRNTTIWIDRPEIKSPLVSQGLTNQLRAALISRGLKESPTDGDVIVDWTVTGQRFAINDWGNAIPLDEIPGERRMPRGNPWRGLPEVFVEGALVVDLTARSSGVLIWRGVYRNRENGSGKLAHQLPDYARKLLAAFPPRKK